MLILRSSFGWVWVVCLLFVVLICLLWVCTRLVACFVVAFAFCDLFVIDYTNYLV